MTIEPDIDRTPPADPAHTAAPPPEPLHVAVAPPSLPPGPAERFTYSYGVRSGHTVWISGQVAMDQTGALVGEGDVEAQAVQVFENLSAVVAAAGGGLGDVVSTVTYMTDRTSSPAINSVRRRYLTGPVSPTSTLLIVAGLARPEFLVEISAVAVLPAAAARWSRAARRSVAARTADGSHASDFREQL